MCHSAKSHMLDGLGIGDDGRIQDSLVLDFACGRVASLIKPSIAGQSVPFGCLPAWRTPGRDVLSGFAYG